MKTQVKQPKFKRQSHLSSDLYYPLEKTSPHSMTKPGDAKTPIEMMNEFKLGFDMREVYVDESINDFFRLDRIDKMQYIRDREVELQQKRSDYLQLKEQIFQQNLKKHEEMKKQQIIEDYKKAQPPATEQK